MDFEPLFPGSAKLPLSADSPKTDEEISKLLCTYTPVRHQRNIWAFWDTGFENMLPWRKRNVISWVHRMGHAWDVRCVDLVPGSPNCLFRFVDKAAFPLAITDGAMEGATKGPHMSDMARLALIYHVGIQQIRQACRRDVLICIAWRCIP